MWSSRCGSLLATDLAIALSNRFGHCSVTRLQKKNGDVGDGSLAFEAQAEKDIARLGQRKCIVLAEDMAARSGLQRPTKPLAAPSLRGQ